MGPIRSLGLFNVVLDNERQSKESEVNATSLRRAFLPGVAALAAVATLAACGSDAETDTGADSGTKGLSGTIAAGGSSAQEKAQEAWRAGFGAANPDVTITYDPVGSGTGRDNFFSGAYKFAGSDSAISADDAALAAESCGTAPIEIPVFISPIDVIFNLDGIETLNLDAATVAKIFNTEIKNWNDKAIADQNPGVDLPDLAIAPVHRSDSSGTTENFTEYLHSASGGAWTTEAGSEWPTQTGEAAEKTAGMIGAVTDGKGTIGYADDSAVKTTALGKVALKVGETYTAPTADGAAAALAASKLVEGASASQLVYEIDRTTTEAGTYPLFMASYFIACETYADANDAAIVKDFGLFLVSDVGQKAASVNAGSAPLPADIAAQATTILEGISAK